MNYDQLKLENQLCFPFYAVSRLIIRAYQEDLDQLEITYPQYLVLLVLWEKDGITVNEISEKLVLNTNTVTPLLKRMEKQSLITRTSTQDDLRKVVVRLTENGMKMRERSAQIPYNLIAKLNFQSSEFSMEDVNTLKSMLSKLIIMLNKSEN